MESALKNLVSSAGQYISNRNDASNHALLQKHLDTFVALTSNGSNLNDLYSNQLLLMECTSNLISILDEPEVECILSSKIFCIFHNFMQSPCLNHMVKTKFHLTSTLASYLCSRHDKEEDPNLFQCLEILKLQTYKTEIAHPEGYLDDLLKFLLKWIQATPPHPLRPPCLMVLANLCSNNSLFQIRIKNMENVNSFYRCVLYMINSKGDDMLTITALSMIANLAFNEEIGEKLFYSNNIKQTLKLVISIIMHKDPDVQCVAIDLFVELLQYESVQQSLFQYKHLDVCLTKIFEVIDRNSNPKSAAKIYELLLSVCSVDSLRRMIIPLIFNEEAKSSSKVNPISVALYWFCQALDTVWNAPIWAAKFLAIIIKNAPCQEGSTLMEPLENLLSKIVSDLEGCCEASDMELERMCQKCIASIAILHNLCEHEGYRSEVSAIVKVDVCSELIETHLERFNESHSTNLNESACTIDVMLYCLKLMDALKGSVNGMTDQLYQYLQDPKMMKILANALCSTSEKRIETALNLICLGDKLSNFPSIRLCGFIEKCNRNRLKLCQDSTSCNGYPRFPSLSKCDSQPVISGLLPKIHVGKNSKRLDATVENLIESVEKGLQVKDLKSSQIMEMYEHKIASLQMKEQQLQNLLEAKSLSMRYTDRLLAQYHCRWAQSDAEALKLRDLLKESELRSEAAKGSATSALVGQQQLQLKLKAAVEDNYILNQHLEEQKDANFAVNNKLQALQERLMRLKQENISMVEFNAVLQRQHEAYKQKEEEMAEKLLNLEADKLNMIKQLKEREAKNNDLTKQLHALEAKAAAITSECEQLNRGIDEKEDVILNLERELAALETSRYQLETKLELAKTELAKLRLDYEKNQQELSKQQKITAMIYSLTSSGLNQECPK